MEHFHPFSDRLYSKCLLGPASDMGAAVIVQGIGSEEVEELWIYGSFLFLHITWSSLLITTSHYYDTHLPLILNSDASIFTLIFCF